jgi:hypothetical protein
MAHQSIRNAPAILGTGQFDFQPPAGAKAEICPRNPRDASLEPLEPIPLQFVEARSVGQRMSGHENEIDRKNAPTVADRSCHRDRRDRVDIAVLARHMDRRARAGAA